MQVVARDTLACIKGFSLMEIIAQKGLVNI